MEFGLSPTQPVTCQPYSTGSGTTNDQHRPVVLPGNKVRQDPVGRTVPSLEERRPRDAPQPIDPGVDVGRSALDDTVGVQQQAVTGLERGDGVSVDVVRSNGELWARQIEVVRNVRDSYGGGNYGGDLRGAVSFVDPRAQIIGITNGGYDARREQVRYDSRTVVEYRGRRVRPEQLESGDMVSIQARRSGNGWLAERVRVERSVREY